jgi:hypothetical protein
LEVANAPDPDVCVRIITCLQWPIRVKQLEPPGEAFSIFCGCLDLQALNNLFRFVIKELARLAMTFNPLLDGKFIWTSFYLP